MFERTRKLRRRRSPKDGSSSDKPEEKESTSGAPNTRNAIIAELPADNFATRSSASAGLALPIRNHAAPPPPPPSTVRDTLNRATAQYLNQGSALYDVITSRLDDVITRFDAGERDIPEPAPTTTIPRGLHTDSDVSLAKSITSTSHSTGTHHFSKVWQYSNSRLPPFLPPCKLYLSTYPLLCLAAQHSLSVYTRPQGKEKEHHIAASVRHGTKAMTLKSLPVDDMNTIVFAIRGSDSFLDWAINFKLAPTPPTSFLDDTGNLCHAGFLAVARSTLSSVAERLRTLLQGDPSRSAASLLITGHSAGGAVAQLLYAHMMSTEVKSDLTHLTSFFKRVHCVTFGAPPVSLLPLHKPSPHIKRHRKSLFLAYANEGDPVVRADKAVLRSLVSLLIAPSPLPPSNAQSGLAGILPALKQGKRIKHPSPMSASTNQHSTSLPNPSKAPLWVIPPSTLSCAGRIILLREKLGGQDKDDVEACQVSDEELRKVVFGDPVCHSMALYARRIEVLATKAVTGRMID